MGSVFADLFSPTWNTLLAGLLALSNSFAELDEILISSTGSI
jgi:hypothetical protein